MFLFFISDKISIFAKSFIYKIQKWELSTDKAILTR